MNYEWIQQLDNYITRNRYRLINSVLLYKDGELVIERYYNRYDENSRNNIKSIWKSILSICTGICIDKGLIQSIEQPISDFLPQFDGKNHRYHKLIRISHLLTMTSGIYWNGGIHYHCPMLIRCMRSSDMIGYIADVQVSHVPGTKYNYKEWDVMILSAILSKATGMNTYEFCDKYLYQPLDIFSGQWWTSACGLTYNIGISEEAEALSDLSAKDLSKLGFLFLNEGMYNDRQIVSKQYVKQAITPSFCNSKYGLMWWIEDNTYGCRGYGGQEITVVPDDKIIYVMQATATNSGKSYGDVYHYLRSVITV